MLEALWSVEFQSSLGAMGGGIVVLETGRVLGGDVQYTYIGNYKISPDGKTIDADVEVKKYGNVPGIVSVFGPAQLFSLKLSGTPAPNNMTLSGHVAGQPHLKIDIRFSRQAELP